MASPGAGNAGAGPLPGVVRKADTRSDLEGGYNQLSEVITQTTAVAEENTARNPGGREPMTSTRQEMGGAEEAGLQGTHGSCRSQIKG